MIDDLAKGVIDVAVAWGPIGGYFAKKSEVPMEVKLAPEYEKSMHEVKPTGISRLLCVMATRSV